MKTKNEELGSRIAVGVFWSIIWIFSTGVMYFFNEAISKTMFYLWVFYLLFIILKGGYNGIFRKRK